MVVCGTLAQRGEPSRSTIRALWGAGAPVAVDLNLREPFVDEAVVGASLRAAALAKLNEDELARLRAWYDLPAGLGDACEALARRFDLRTVCVTRGSAGAVLLHEGVYAAHPGAPATVVDTVGAGDAFLAALLAALLAGAAPEVALDRAAHRGAQVASQRGAIPSGVG
jgi:fructokinase